MRLLSGVVLLVVASVSAQVPQAARDQALGRVLSKEIEGRERLVDDSQVVDYVGAISRKLSPFCGANNAQVRVTQSESVNASVIPGGQIYVTTGLLRFVDNESELAGVLAHLMKRNPGQANPAGAAGDQFLLTPDTVIPRGLEANMLRAVSAADEQAMQCMDRAGYDPVGLILLLQRMPAVPVERMEKVAETIMALEPSSAYLLNTPRFVELRRHLASLTSRPSLNR